VTDPDDTARVIARERAARQLIAAPSTAEPAGIVRHMLAMQAQDFAGAKWAIGARSTHLSHAQIEAALERAEIVRSWPMRGTLHVMAAEDARWMVALLAHRAIKGAARRHRELEIDDDTRAASATLLEQEMREEAWMSRPDVYAALERGGIATGGQRGIHILGWAAQSGLIVCGPTRGKQPSFGWSDRHIPLAPAKPRDEALRDLAARYFVAHSPAKVADLAWWAGIPLSDARAAILLAADTLESEQIGGVEFWRTPAPSPAPAVSSVQMLPPFDEILLGYTDRSAPVDPVFQTLVMSGLNGIIQASIARDGRIVGTWRRAVRKDTVTVTPQWFPELPDRPDLGPLVMRYGEYLGLTAVCSDT
jgi:hypothetical protein